MIDDTVFKDDCQHFKVVYSRLGNVYSLSRGCVHHGGSALSALRASARPSEQDTLAPAALSLVQVCCFVYPALAALALPSAAGTLSTRSSCWN